MTKLKKGISFVFLVSFLFVFLCPTSVLASTIGNYEAQRDIDKLLEYSIVNPDKTIDFDEEKAIANGESEEILKMGMQLERVAAEYYNARQGIATAGLPIYGNWCGPGYGGGTPIDYLDAACKEHDECYGEAPTYFDCDCDQQIINRINRDMYLMSGEQLSMAKTVVAYFTAQRQAMCCDGCP